MARSHVNLCITVLLLCGCGLDRSPIGQFGRQDAATFIPNDAQTPRPLDASTPPVAMDASLPPISDTGVPAPRFPELTEASYEIVAHGGTTTLRGNRLDEVFAVDLNGLSVPFELTALGEVRLSVSDDIPVGPTTARVRTPDGEATFPLTIIHLVLNELNVDNPGFDNDRQYIEIATGVANVNLNGYQLVLFTGSDDSAYESMMLNAETDSQGLLIVGSTGVGPDIAIGDDSIRVGVGTGMAIALYQERNDFREGDPVTGTRLIDALVYAVSFTLERSLNETLLVPEGQEVVYEPLAVISDNDSIQRCENARRDSRAFRAAAPTPDNSNDC